MAAQQGAVPAAGITVTGYGAASTSAQSAEIQIILSQTNYGPPTAPNTGATPGAEQREQAASTVDALVATGVAEADIELIVSPGISTIYGPSGGSVARIDVRVLDPTRERVGQIIDAATVGAAQERLVLGQIGVGYGTTDCAPIQRQAREAALADARAQGELQADLLGVALGDVMGTTDIPVNAAGVLAPYYGSFAPVDEACGPAVPSLPVGASISVPPFDPTAEAVVTVYAQVDVTFAMTLAPMATPAA